MSNLPPGLAFEQPILDMDQRIAELEAIASPPAETADQLRQLRRERTELIRSIYSQLDPWQVVQVARHPNRPQTTDYLELVFDEFLELHGDRCFGDDRAMRTGFAKVDGQKVLVVGHQKGKTLKERNACYFGCASGRLSQGAP